MAQRGCTQRFSEVAFASARDAQEWVVSCPSTVRAHKIRIMAVEAGH